MMMKVAHILETCLYVDHLDRAERFYVDVLGLELVSRQEGRDVFLRCGQRMLLLFNPLASRETNGRFPPHGGFGAVHLAFGVCEADVPGWSQLLAEHSVPVEQVIDWPGGGRSLYFRDPAGNLLEFATPRIWGIGEETLS